MFMLSALVVPLDRYGSEEVLPVLWEERLSDARRCWSPTLSAAWRLVIGVVEVEVEVEVSEKLSHLRRALLIAGRGLHLYIYTAEIQHANFRSRESKQRDETLA